MAMRSFKRGYQPLLVPSIGTELSGNEESATYGFTHDFFVPSLLTDPRTKVKPERFTNNCKRGRSPKQADMRSFIFLLKVRHAAACMFRDLCLLKRENTEFISQKLKSI